MKTNVKRIGECKRLLEVELPKDVVSKEFNKVYGELKKRAFVPGFRIGKAPQDLLEKYYSETAANKVTQRLISESLELAVREANLAPISLPQIRDVRLEGKSAD